jgi:hypothetical protein
MAITPTGSGVAWWLGLVAARVVPNFKVASLISAKSLVMMTKDRTRPYIARSSKRSSTAAAIPGTGGEITRAQSLRYSQSLSPPLPPPTPPTDIDDEGDDDNDDEQSRLVSNQRHSPLRNQVILSPCPTSSPSDSASSPPSHPSPSSPPPPSVNPHLSRQLTRLTAPIQIQTNLQIFRVHKIDSSSEEFTIDCGITFLWTDPFLAAEARGKYFSSHPAVVRHNPKTGRSDYELWPDHFIVGQTVFDPAWKIMNSSDLEVIKNFTTILNSEEGVVHNYLHIRATIYQTLDLHSFPFDHQELTLRIQSEHSSQVVHFVAMADRSPRLYDNNIASEWNIHCDSMQLHFDMDNRPAASGLSLSVSPCLSLSLSHHLSLPQTLTHNRGDLCRHEVHLQCDSSGRVVHLQCVHHLLRHRLLLLLHVLRPS